MSPNIERMLMLHRKYQFNDEINIICIVLLTMRYSTRKHKNPAKSYPRVFLVVIVFAENERFSGSAIFRFEKNTDFKLQL